MVRRAEVERRLEAALEHLLREDQLLFRRNVSEWSVAHRLGVYLERSFPEYDVDCEFNRNLVDSDDGFIDNSKRVDSDLRRPDIIVHERADPDDDSVGENLLIVELKVNTETDGDADLVESTREELGYTIGAFIDLHNNPTDPELWNHDYIVWKPPD